MNNQDKIHKYVIDNPIGDEFRYSDILFIAKSILRGTSVQGKSYAVLKYIQNYCNATLKGNPKTIIRNGDPRSVLKVDKLKQMRFTIRTNMLKLQDKQIRKTTPKAKIKSGEANNKECPESYEYDDLACCNQGCFDRETQEFREWLLGALHEFPGFVHEWRARSGMNKSGLMKGRLWSCTSLFSAYQQYVWPAQLQVYRNKVWRGRFFGETDLCLGKLKISLEEAILKKNNNECRRKCREIFEWGGVDGRPNVAPHIKGSIPIGQLSGHLSDTRDLLNRLLRNGCDHSNVNYSDKVGIPIKVDAGTTKLYSLICENFIMYDGRVASALGYLVRKWCEHKHADDESYEGIPNCLRFSFDNNTRKGIQYRNPNPVGPDGKRLTIFKPLVTIANNRRVRENIQASWLLEKVLQEDVESRVPERSSFSYIEDFQKRLRALESAIFMIGYSLPIANSQ